MTGGGVLQHKNTTSYYYSLASYKSNLKQIFNEKILPTVGSIVMNCNPFTFGHRYLVEESLKHCDKLIVFVVEEDKSIFPFKDRFKLVKENLIDLENVIVIPSGEFIISTKTFAEYFLKESIQSKKIDTSLDVTLFAKEIAPCLNITIRFAGEEPFDKVTAQYNESMRKILPQYNIQFIEIKRKTLNNKVISATEVRKLLEDKNFNAIKDLVPQKTYEYLTRSDKK